MTTEPTPSPNAARFERTYDAPAKLIWELWTTAAGLGASIPASVPDTLHAPSRNADI